MNRGKAVLSAHTRLTHVCTPPLAGGGRERTENGRERGGTGGSGGGDGEEEENTPRAPGCAAAVAEFTRTKNG